MEDQEKQQEQTGSQTPPEAEAQETQETEGAGAVETQAAAPESTVPSEPAGADEASNAAEATEGTASGATENAANAVEAADTAEAPAGEPEKGFAELLAEHEGEAAKEPKKSPGVGDKVKGKIVSIGETSAIVDLGLKSEATLDTAQLKDAEGNLTVAEGDPIEATVAAVDPETGTLTLKRRAGRSQQQEVPAAIRQAHQDGLSVEGQVTGINKGGAEVQVSGMRAFCPLSQLDMRYVENPQQFVGQRLEFKVARIEEGKKGRRPDIVLSRRALLEEEAQAKAADLRGSLKVGSTVTGRITSITNYGAFLDLGGLEGLLHVSEIGFSRLTDPKDVLQVGQELEVQIIKIEAGKDDKRQERISLSRKALERDPWSDAADRYPEGTQLTGRVVRLETFGAFVELTPGLEGLVHISELGAGRRVNHPRDVVDVGQEVTVRVLGVDRQRRRISLSMALDGPSESPAPRERGGRDRDRDRERDRDFDRDAMSSSPPSGGSFGSLGDFFNKRDRRR